MKYLINDLRRHKWRTIAGISGYLLATLFIMLVLSVNYTNQRDSVGILKGTGTHFIVYMPSSASCCVSPNNDTPDGSLIAEGGYTMMLNSDLIYSVSDIPGVKEVAPYLLYSIFDKNLNTRISLGGIDTNSIATRNNVCAVTNLVEGTYLSGKPDEIVVEESFARAHKLSAGDTLHTYGGKLIVSGIVNSGIKPGKADLYAPIDNVRKILRDNLHCISDGFDLNILLVEVEDARIQNRVINQLKERMSYLSVSSYNCYQPASEVMNIMDGTSTLMTVVVFLFLVIFSAKTQLTSMMERFREIGILKSLGWSHAKLSRQIILLSLIQSLTGAISGILTGIVLIIILNKYDIRILHSMEFQFQPWNILFLTALSLTGGLIATIFPIIKLYKTKAGEMINSYM